MGITHRALSFESQLAITSTDWSCVIAKNWNTNYSFNLHLKARSIIEKLNLKWLRKDGSLLKNLLVAQYSKLKLYFQVGHFLQHTVSF